MSTRFGISEKKDSHSVRHIGYGMRIIVGDKRHEIAVGNPRQYVARLSDDEALQCETDNG